MSQVESGDDVYATLPYFVKAEKMCLIDSPFK